MEAGKSPAEAFLAGRKYAQAYAAYAKSAQSCAGVPPLGAAIDAAALKLGGLLGQAMLASKDPATTATLWGTAFAGFWLTPAIPFPSPAPGLVTVAVPATLAAALLATWIQGPCELNLSCRKMAGVLHAWTQSVVAAHGPVPACVSGLI